MSMVPQWLGNLLLGRSLGKISKSPNSTKPLSPPSPSSPTLPVRRVALELPPVNQDLLLELKQQPEWSEVEAMFLRDFFSLQDAAARQGASADDLLQVNHELQRVQQYYLWAIRRT